LNRLAGGDAIRCSWVIEARAGGLLPKGATPFNPDWEGLKPSNGESEDTDRVLT
jgi:hypothetical protein